MNSNSRKVSIAIIAGFLGLCGAGQMALRPHKPVPVAVAAAETDLTLTEADLTKIGELINSKVAPAACKCTAPPSLPKDPANPPGDPPVDPSKLHVSIEGPDTAAIGETVQLVAKSNAKRLDWIVEVKVCGPYEGGTILNFSTMTPGPVKITLAGSNDAELIHFTKIIQIVSPVPAPSPKPEPPAKPDPPKPDPTKRASSATYIYEKSQTALPREVLSTLSKLNVPGGFVASTFEQNTPNGRGQVPVQYAVALDAAKQVGLPCLVVQAGDSVLRVVKDPKTSAQVLEAVK